MPASVSNEQNELKNMFAGPEGADWPPLTQAWAIPQILIKGIDEAEESTGPSEVSIDRALMGAGDVAWTHSGQGGTHSGLHKLR